MKKKVLSFLFIALFACFLTSCDKTSNGKLDKVTNVKVSSNGLVEWTEVKNATSYDVILRLGQEESTSNTKECKYQLKDLKNDYDISVIAKAKNYEDSDESDKVTYLGLYTKEKNNYYENLVNGTIGDLDPDATDKEKANYNEIATYFKEASKKAVEAGYDHKSGAKLVEALSAASTKEEALSVLTMTLTAYSPKEIESTVYYFEIYVVSSLIAMRQKLETEQIEDVAVTNYPVDKVQQIALINKVIETLNANDLEFATHLANILNTTISTYKTLAMTFIPKIMDIVNDAQNEVYDAEKIYEAKNALVKALKENTIASDDIIFILNLVTAVKNEAIDVIFASIPTSEIPAGVLEMLAEVKTMIKDLEDVDFTDLVLSVEQIYLGLLNSIEGISKEYIQNVVNQETPEKMLAYVIITTLQSLPIEPVEVTDETIAQLVGMINSILTMVMGDGENEVTIETLIGLTDEDVISALRILCDLDYALDQSMLNLLQSEEFLQTILNALDTKIVDESNGSYASGVVGEDPILVKAANGKQIEEYSAYAYFEIYQTEDGSWVAYSLIVGTEDFVTDSTGTTQLITYNFDERTITVKNAANLIPVAEMILGMLKENKTLVEGALVKLVEVLGKVTLPEGADETLAAIISMLPLIKEESLTKAIEGISTLLNEVIKVAKVLPLDEVIAKLLSGDEESLAEVVEKIAKAVDINNIHSVVESISYLAEDLGLLSLVDAETREDFVKNVNAMIDSQLGITQE